MGERCKLTGTGNSLAVALVLDVTASEDTLDTGEAGAGLSDNVAILIELKLALDQGVGGVVANSVEETVSLNDLLLVVGGALDAEVGHEAVRLALTDNLGGDGVEANSALGVVEQTISHNLGGTQLVTADQHGDVATVLGQEHGLLGGRVTTTNDVQGLVAEDGDSTVADSAGADTVLPELLLAGQVEATGIGTGSDDNGVRSVSGLVVGTVVPLGPHLEGPLGQIQLGDGLGDDLGTEALGLGAHLVHQLGTADTVGEAGEVLDISGGGQLATGGGTVSEHTLVQDRLKFSAREIDSGSVGARARADNCGKKKKSSD